MKRFYTSATVAKTDHGFIVELDGKPIRTPGGEPQLLPTRALAEAMAREWQDQGDEIDPARFAFRDMADYAIDVVMPEPAAIAEKLLRYAETDTLCYRAAPDEPLFRRQEEVWEPLLAGFEAREGITLVRVSGVVHKAQPAASLDALGARIEAMAPFALAALEQLTTLAHSLCIGLAAMEPDADGTALWDAANLEEDWQVELWGEDHEAAERRAKRKGDFLGAMAFARAAAA